MFLLPQVVEQSLFLFNKHLGKSLIFKLSFQKTPTTNTARPFRKAKSKQKINPPQSGFFALSKDGGRRKINQPPERKKDRDIRNREEVREGENLLIRHSGGEKGNAVQKSQLMSLTKAGKKLVDASLFLKNIFLRILYFADFTSGFFIYTTCCT